MKIYLVYTLVLSCVFKFILGRTDIQLISLVTYVFAPLCLIYVIKKDYDTVLNGFYWYFLVLNIFNILFLFVPCLKGVLGDEWYCFSGHIQSTPMLWSLTLFVGLIRYFYEGRRMRSTVFLLIYMLLPTIVMITTGVTTGVLALLSYLLSCFFVFFKKKSYSLRCKQYYIVYTIGLTFNFLLVKINLQNYFSVFLNKYLHQTTTLNGRVTIWERFQEAIDKSFILGYGYNGIKVNVGWGGDWNSLNYAHNTILQEWSNGGIIGLTLFILLSFQALKIGAGVRNIYYKKATLCSLIALLVIMCSESMSFYNYYLLFIVLVMFMPKIDFGESNSKHTVTRS